MAPLAREPMATIIRCIRDAGTNDPVYVNNENVRYFDAASKHVIFHFAKGESITVKETLEKVIELLSGE